MEADPDAVYERVVKIDLSKLVPVTSYPHLPENTHPVSESHHIKIDQVVVGSCTNGRLEDIAQAAEVLKDHKVNENVRCIIIPATQEIYQEAIRLGYVDIFINAGAAVSTPTCGPCLGGYMGILAAGERCVSTTNRNFRGRMGGSQRGKRLYRFGRGGIRMSKIWRYGDHVDTDVIIPARYLNISDFKELAEHAMEDIDTTFAPNVKKDEIMVAGKNFGCGSSREHAPVVIKVKGIKCIIADSFARIFYRNAINIGLPVLEIGAEVEKIEKGDDVEVDLKTGEIKIVNKNLVIKTKPLPDFCQKIADCGGLVNYVKSQA